MASIQVCNSFATTAIPVSPSAAPGVRCPDRDGLPLTFPNYVSTNLAWCGSDISQEREYVYHLSDIDKCEIDSALAHFKGFFLDGDLVNQDNFNLPHLRHVLNGLAADLYSGKGFFILRGLDPSKYTVEDSTVIFLGIQAYIAPKRGRQDELGNMIVHIISDLKSSSNPMRRKHARHSKNSMPFHTDPVADILAFQTRSAAAHGGRCVLSSVNTIYNELATTRPDIIRTLATPNWPFSLPYFHQRPLLFHHDSTILFSCNRAALIGSSSQPRPSTVPSLTPRQREALDVVNALAEAHRFEFATQPGDLHFVNNLALLHRRDCFEDGDGQRRHLARMYLRNESLRPKIPEVLAALWDPAFDEAMDQKWHIEPMPEGFLPVRMGSY